MPRALTEQEKCRQCQKLLQKGKHVILSQGIKNISVDEIAKAAGMAKGSFYRHFESKEEYLYELIWDIHNQFFAQVEQTIREKSNLPTEIRYFIKNLFHMPEMIFFIKYYREIDEIINSLPNHQTQSSNQMEADIYGKLLTMAGIDIKKVKPGVVHNYLHTIYLMMGSDLMIKDDIPETFDRLIDSLILYIFGGSL